jgi:GxxExxY protein
MRTYSNLGGATVTGAAASGDDFPEKELTEKIVGCAIAVHRALGPGYLEIVYENAMSHELGKCGLDAQRQRVVKVYYDGIEVGEHRIDIIVNSKVVLELKSVDSLSQKHLAQVISTLKAAGAKVGLLINFDEAKVVDGIRRVVL